MSKAEKLRERTEIELESREHELRDQLFKLRFQRATGSMEIPTKMREVKREIARIQTILRERRTA